VNNNYPANRARLAAEQDHISACIVRANDYLARTGLSQADFARRVGYGSSSIGKFLNGRYEGVAGTAVHVVKKLNNFMDAHPIGGPARVLGHLYETENVRTIQQTFEKLLPRPVAYMIYAPPGSQKTFVLEHQVARLNASEIASETGRRAFYVYARAGIRPRDLMRRVAIACGCRTNIDIDPMIANLRFEFRNHRVVLVVDESQHLSLDCFEVLRELLDQPPYFSLLLAGSHDLKKKFDEFSATLEQWNSRIIAKVRLPGLERKEARGIVEREIGDLLKRKTAREAEDVIAALIGGATVRDAFEGNRTYINVRTLTNALDQIKAAAQPAADADETSEVA
jgi:DNA transposition AAA+ family ATPase